MHRIRSPQPKVGLIFKQNQQKTHIHMNNEQCSTLIALGIKKEIKDFLEFNKTEDTSYQNL